MRFCSGPHNDQTQVKRKEIGRIADIRFAQHVSVIKCRTAAARPITADLADWVAGGAALLRPLVEVITASRARNSQPTGGSSLTSNLSINTVSHSAAGYHLRYTAGRQQ